ncbi:helix-turn-helix transcriptional regulator [Actinacidiphila acididurans]|uniref:AAA family ATPase n=1 Tax=Actinacidiphila acididurans TaxID=2784346 RepID=A0ABS2TL63_9ACTN|nr:LuxR family transcriptional regulator [Actinacidiphila acididurans]MBM9504078.1 AAA family ATPase [Actinacidiphila acididurans]
MRYEENLSGRHGPLVGRDADIERITALVGGREGNALVVSGEAGAGKSALLGAVADGREATGTRVVRGAGAEFEADISYAGLHQMLYPLRDTFGELDDTHREALRVALGLGAGDPPDRLLVCNATLILLQKAAARAPLLVVMDDFAWLDKASQAVLGFVARRIGGSAVSLLVAARSFPAGPNRSALPVYELPPLPDEAADALLTERFPDLSRRVRVRLLQSAGGNPLALLELPAALRSSQRAAHEELPPVLPLGVRLQDLFVRRVSSLPSSSLNLLLLATLEGSGDLATVLYAARRLDTAIDLADLAPAEREGLIEVDEGAGRILFRHPLIRSGVVAATTSGSRRAAHSALADVLARRPERQAWHLAEATVAPDERVAALLERAAHHVMRRGDAVSAVTALARAAHLSPGGPDRARRLAEAAYIGADAAGALSVASELLEDARRADPLLGGSLRAAAAAVMLVLNRDGTVETAHRLLVGAIESGDHRHDSGDGALVDALHLLALLCFYSGREDLWRLFHEAMRRLRPDVPDPLAATALTIGDPARTAAQGRPRMEAALERVRDETDPALIIRAGTAAVYADRLGDLREASWRVVRQGRDGGPVRHHLGGLVHLCMEDWTTGRWDEAIALAQEGAALCDTSGYKFFRWYYEYPLAVIAGARGDTDTCHTLADHMTHWALPRGVQAAADYAEHSRIVADLGAGDFDSAFHHAERVSPAGELAPYRPHALWIAMDLVEAAVHTGRVAEAQRHVEALRAADPAAVSSRLVLLWGAAEALCARADDESLRLFEKALAGPGVARWSFDAARVQLAYGERLRRARAAAEARKALRTAADTFHRIGARPWEERAAKELRAAGGAGPRSQEMTAGNLTPQEQEIAQLAASGMTNKQIAARLFLSHRTVGAHLYQIFPKLGIRSRAALRDALDALR